MPSKLRFVVATSLCLPVLACGGDTTPAVSGTAGTDGLPTSSGGPTATGDSQVSGSGSDTDTQPTGGGGNCGNGVLDPGEVCDDDNAVGGDGCNASCTSEEFCGNDVVDAINQEQCDDGNVVPGDGCDASCQLEVEIPKLCGDDELDEDAGEQCDDGNNVGGDGCDPLCQIKAPPGCGNDNVGRGERCDDGGNKAGDGCSPACQFEECGNNVLDPGEQCEDGNADSGDGCDSQCQFEVAAACGNGRPDPGEQCDDGNADNGDGCLNNCVDASCGDGHVWVGYESCDDSNVADGDGCDANCVSEACGDGDIDLAEQCDNGGANGTPGNSCYTTCTLIDLDVAMPITMDLDTRVRGEGPMGIVADDFNGDGRPDLVTVNMDSADVTVSYGMGDGRMWTPFLRTVNGNARDVALADLNGDGRLDAVTANGSTNTISVLLGGGVAFDEASSFSAQFGALGATPSGIALADVTGNGETDAIVSLSSSDTVTVMEGDGAGGFAQIAALMTNVAGEGQEPWDVQVADVTNDGVLDIVTCNRATDDVSLFVGLGGGNFDAAAVFTTRVGAGGERPWALVLADVSGDGVPDAITANEISDDVSVLVSAPASNSFLPPIRFSTLQGPLGEGPRGLAVGDVTGDGEPDIVTADYASDGISVLQGVAGGATFLAAEFIATNGESFGNAPRRVELADFDGDGNLDILVAAEQSSDLEVLLGSGGGAFGPATPYESALGYDGTLPGALALGDVNEDGSLDAIVATNGGDVVVVAGLGGGEFARSQTTSTDPGGRFIDTGDNDGDGLLDWVIGTSGSQVNIGRMLDSGEYNRTDYTADTQVRGVAFGLLDDNDSVDLVTGSWNGNRIRRQLNNGSGSLVSNANMGTVSDPAHLAVADVNADGELDAVVVSQSQDYVRVFAGTSEGELVAAGSFTTAQGTSGRDPVFVVVAEVTGDGVPDMITANSTSSDVSVLAGQGGGVFSFPVIVPAVFNGDPAEIWGVGVGDFDNDGIPDIATANYGRDSVSIMFGFGGGSFSAPQEFAVGSQPRNVAIADYNNDGFDDIATSNYGEGSITVLLSLGH